MLISLLPRLIQHANAAVHDCTLDSEYRGKSMATTWWPAPFATIRQSFPMWRFTLLHGSQRKGPADHAGPHAGQRAAEDGLISTEDYPELRGARHVLIRSLGPEMFVSPDTTALTLQAGDVLVLCTDGLHDEMHGETIAEIVSQKKTMDEVARELVAKSRRDRRRRQHHRAGYPHPLRRASRHVPRTPIPAALLTETLTEYLPFQGLFPIEWKKHAPPGASRTMSFYDSLEAGSQVDSYRIDAPIARSGMASIYRAIECAR